MADIALRKKSLSDRIATMPERYVTRVESFIAGLGWSREEVRAERHANPQPRTKPRQRGVRAERSPPVKPTLRLIVNNMQGGG